MSGDLRTLARNCERRAKAIERNANDCKIEAASQMLEYLVDATPVDTSKALSNWQVGVGRPVSAEIEAHVRGEAGSTADASAAVALANGLGQIRRAKPGQPVYLSNLVPYIRRLNNGWSKQAPAGFIDGAIEIGRMVVRSVQFVRLRK